MKTLSPITFLLCLAGVFCTSYVHAALTMTVDSANKTITFGTSSTTSGTPDFGGGFSVNWQTNAFPIVPEIGNVDITSALQLDGGPIDNAELALVGTFGDLTTIITSNSTFSIVSGTGSSVSYAGLSSGLQQGLESFAAANSVIPLDGTGGFGNLQTTLIPETNMYALTAGISALFLILLRQRK